MVSCNSGGAFWLPTSGQTSGIEQKQRNFNKSQCCLTSLILLLSTTPTGLPHLLGRRKTGKVGEAFPSSSTSALKGCPLQQKKMPRLPVAMRPGFITASPERGPSVDSVQASSPGALRGSCRVERSIRCRSPGLSNRVSRSAASGRQNVAARALLFIILNSRSIPASAGDQTPNAIRYD